MRFRITVGYAKPKKGDAEWPEDYDKPIKDPNSWGQKTIERFNATLHPGERARRFIKAEVLNESTQPHDWEKTNSITIMKKGGGNYDTYECRMCGITAKRFGLGDRVRDPQYSAKAYEHCDTAQKQLKKNNARRDRQYQADYE